MNFDAQKMGSLNKALVKYQSAAENYEKIAKDKNDNLSTKLVKFGKRNLKKTGYHDIKEKLVTVMQELYTLLDEQPNQKLNNRKITQKEIRSIMVNLNEKIHNTLDKKDEDGTVTSLNLDYEPLPPSQQKPAAPNVQPGADKDPVYAKPLKKKRTEERTEDLYSTPQKDKKQTESYYAEIDESKLAPVKSGTQAKSNTPKAVQELPPQKSHYDEIKFDTDKTGQSKTGATPPETGRRYELEKEALVSKPQTPFLDDQARKVQRTNSSDSVNSTASANSNDSGFITDTDSTSSGSLEKHDYENLSTHDYENLSFKPLTAETFWKNIDNYIDNTTNNPKNPDELKSILEQLPRKELKEVLKMMGEGTKYYNPTNEARGLVLAEHARKVATQETKETVMKHKLYEKSKIWQTAAEEILRSAGHTGCGG